MCKPHQHGGTPQVGFIDKVEDSETVPGSTCSLVLIVTETEGGREWGVNEDVMR